MALFANPTIFIIPGKTGEIGQDVGSGILVETQSGNYLAITAKHVAEPAKSKQHRMGVQGHDDALNDFVEHVFLHPDSEIDVGIILIKKKFYAAVRTLSVSYESIQGDTNDITADSALHLTGFPANFVMISGNKGIQEFNSLTYECEFKCIDPKGRLVLDWRFEKSWFVENAHLADHLERPTDSPAEDCGIPKEMERLISGRPQKSPT